MTPIEALTIIVSFAALGLSGWQFWRTELRRGQPVLSRPTMFFFGWDARVSDDTPKVMFRAAMFSTAATGFVLENMYLKVQNATNNWVLPFWGYDDGSGMVRGSGVYIGRDGHVANHHFNPLSEESDFYYDVGAYTIEVWVRRHGDKVDTLIGTYEFDLDDGLLAADLVDHQAGILWSWDPVGRFYQPERSERRSKTEALTA
ncbi:MAG: hypothetical protein ACYC0C_10510 [Devosia sp.]